VEHFFRLGDTVIVKDLECLRNEGIMVHEAEDDYGNKISYCMRYGIMYSIFEDYEHRLPGSIGTVCGGIYDKYLDVRIGDLTYILPHFILKPVISEVVELEENTYYDIEE
jgi:hypothetical protein